MSSGLCVMISGLSSTTHCNHMIVCGSEHVEQSSANRGAGGGFQQIRGQELDFQAPGVAL